MLEKAVLLLGIALLTAACVAAGGSGASPELTEEVEADLSARALAIACAQQCVGNEVPIRDLVYETSNVMPLVGPPLTDVQRQALTQQFLNVRFLNDEAARELLAADQVVLAMGPVSVTGEGEVEVEVLAEGSDSQVVYLLPYHWSGGEWVPTP